MPSLVPVSNAANEACLQSKLTEFEANANGRKNRETGKKRTAGTARLEYGIDFSNGVTVGARGGPNEALKIPIGEAMIEDGMQHVARAQDESGFVVPQGSAKRRVQKPVESSTEETMTG